MFKQDIHIVHLRRPQTDDRRDDPFWEFGSFGLTGCHGTNLLSLKNANALQGKRLAFVQGGKQGTRLVLLTPPVTVHTHRSCIEAIWKATESGMPFRYGDAPVIVENDSTAGYRTDFPKTAFKYVNGPRPPEGQFASNFRSRVAAIEPEYAREIIKVYERLREMAKEDQIAKKYHEALPRAIANPDEQRRSSYKELLARAEGASKSCKIKSVKSKKPRRFPC